MAGSLVHFELACSHPEQARSFFGALFGWQPQPFGDTSYFYVDGSPSGGLMSGKPGTVIVYFDVDDIESGVERVRSLGGTAEEIQDLPGIGRSVHCRDDQGTAFSLFQGSSEARREQ